MTLADLRRLLCLSDQELLGFRERFRAIGFDASFLARLARVGERLDDSLRAPMRIWHARRMREPAAVAARLFVLPDAVDAHDAERALGDPAPWLDAGLIERDNEGLVSPMSTGFADDLCILGDRPGAGPESVPPLGGGTLALLAAAKPSGRVRSALDVGSGAGAVALVLARSATRVVATDLSRRALDLTRLNARLNGIGNVELREGDLFDPVQGERFELVAAQPPFVARRAGAAFSMYAHGGCRGDELTMRILARVVDHLAPGGRAVILADLPLDRESLEARLRRAVGDAPLSLAVLQSPAKNLDEYCTFHAAVEHPRLDEAFSREVMLLRDHFEQLEIRGVALAWLVAQRATQGRFLTVVPVRHPTDVAVTGIAVDRIMKSRCLAHDDLPKLLAACLRLPEGARLVAQPSVAGAPSGSVVIHLPPGRPEWPVVLKEDMAAVVVRIASAPSVLDSIRAMASEGAQPLARVTEHVERFARDALLRGVIDVEG